MRRLAQAAFAFYENSKIIYFAENKSLEKIFRCIKWDIYIYNSSNIEERHKFIY